MRRILWLVAAVALALGACTRVPVAGPVEGVPVTAPPRGVELAPEPPVAGTTPARLIDGFLQAMSDPEADYAVARQYLTREASSQWDPSAAAQIYEGSVLEDDGVFTVQGTVTGRLDPVGRFTAVNEDLVHPLPVMQENGEWRIALAPEGVLVSTFIFERYYAHTTSYFLARSGGHVIPELLHMPEALLTPSRIIEAQIAGPSVQLAPAVRNAIPGGTRLGPEGASVDSSGTARVQLVNLPEGLDEDRRRELAAQLLWTFTAIGRVTGLEIHDGTTQLALPGQDADGVLDLASQQGYQVLSRAATSDLFGVRRGVAGRVSANGQFAPLQSAGLPVSEVAVSLDGALIAHIDEARRTVLIGPMGGQLTHVVPDVVDIRGAQFVLGQLWVTGSTADGAVQLVRIDSQGSSAVADIDSLPGTIVAFASSQAGARTAFIVEDADGTTRFGIGVMSSGARPRLESWTPVILHGGGAELDHFVDIAWSGEAELAVATSQPDGGTVHLVQVDGSLIEDLGPVGEAVVEISALPRMGGDAVAVRSRDDVVLRYEARTRWGPVNLELSEISYPG